MFRRKAARLQFHPLLARRCQRDRDPVLLILGKPLGIVAFSWVAVKLGLARLPHGMNWKILLGAGCLAGIGFTMSIFIAGLGLEEELLSAGKIGTLLGSALSAILGLGFLMAFLDTRTPTIVNRH